MDLQTMVVAELVSKTILVAVLGYLYWIQRTPWLKWFALGWVAGASFNAVLLLVPTGALRSVLLDATACVAAGCFASAAHALVERPLSIAWRVVVPISLGASWALALWQAPPSVSALPAIAVLGCALLLAGARIYTTAKSARTEAAVVGGATALWGVHVLDYPFLSEVRSFAPFGFLISFGLQLCAAVGLALLSVRRYHETLALHVAQEERAERLAAVGRLASSVAHDFNNLLTVVVSDLHDVEGTAADRGRLDDAREAIRRATQLTRRLLTLGRKGEGRLAKVDVSDAVSTVTGMLRRVLPSNVHLHVDVEPGCWSITDPVHLEQVVMNLGLNARDAMPNGGTLRVRTNGVCFDQPWATLGGTLPAGRYTEIAVADEGEGIAPDEMQRIFEPFFTTKRHGHGTGLGLSTVRELTDDAGGGIMVESTVGRGTTFRIYFPATEPAGATLAPDAPQRDVEVQLTTALVVEDDASVMRVVRRVLEREGYVVRTASRRDEALAAASQHFERERVGVLVTDVVLPGASGVEIAHAIRERHPNVAIVVASGNAPSLTGELPAGTVVLSKPFHGVELLEAVRAATRSESLHRQDPPPSSHRSRRG